MARIKIKDIPKDQKISTDELKRSRGGAVFAKYELFPVYQSLPQARLLHDEGGISYEFSPYLKGE